ncbi:MAG: hypothetical protein D6813_13180 [Calditrichaeota bacterium]|nr:MAG: hypothetical protein D6813_13180 [Calditrichota bacterium]
MKKTIPCSIFLLLLYPLNVFSQTIAFPVVETTHEVTVSFTGGFQKLNIQKIDYESHRYFLRTVWNVSKFFSLYGEVGFADLTLKAPNDMENLQSKLRVLAGLGIQIKWLHFRSSGLTFFSQLQGFRQAISPESVERFIVGTVEVAKIKQIKYDWREVAGSAGVEKSLGELKFYAGSQFRFINRDEKHIEQILLEETGSTSLTQFSGEYISGVRAYGFVGLQIDLPDRFQLGLEFIGRNDKDFAIYFGISQSGKL